MSIKSIHDPISKPLAIVVVVVIIGFVLLAISLLWPGLHKEKQAVSSHPLPLTDAERKQLIDSTTGTSAPTTAPSEQKKIIEGMTADTSGVPNIDDAEKQRIIEGMTASE